MNNYSILVPYLAQRVKSELAQRAIHTYQLSTFSLAKNPNLIPSIWYELFKIKNDQSITASLAEGSINADLDRVKLLLADKRGVVTEKTFTYALGSMPEELFDELHHSHPLTKKLATAWLSRGHIPNYALKGAAYVAGGLPQIKALLNSEVYTDQEAVAVLRSIDLAMPTRSRGRTELPSFISDLARLFDLRPSLIPLALDSQNEAITHALSKSRHIFQDDDFTKLINGYRKINNGRYIRDYIDALPMLNVILHPNSSVEVATIAKSALTARTYFVPSSRAKLANQQSDRAYNYLERKKRQKGNWLITQDWSLQSPEVIRLAVATFVTDDKKPNLFPSLFPASSVELAGLPLAQIPATTYAKVHLITQSQIDMEITPQIDALGESGWITFLSLSVGWDGSVLELIQTTQALTAQES